MDYLTYIAVASFIKLLGVIPRRLSLMLTKSIATLVFYIDSRHRRIMLKNLSIAFPTLSRKEKMKIALEAFRNLGRLATEVSNFPRLNITNIDRIVTFDKHFGIENLRRAYSKGRGVLVLTGHFSAWELLPLAAAIHGYPLKFIIRPLDNRYLNKFINNYRKLYGNAPIPKRHATREVLQHLKQGGLVGILIDQNAHPPEGIFVEFFGQLACTTSGLAVLALRAGATVLTAYLVKNQYSESYRILCRELEILRTGNFELDILENTKRFNKEIETIVREHPDQWLWGHRRWKTRPSGECDPIY